MDNSTNSDYLRPEGDFWSKVLLIINHIIILPIILGNIFVLIVYKKVLRIRKSPVNLLLVNLAVADLFTGLIGIPWTAWVHYGPYGWDAFKYPCLLSYAAGHIPLGVSCMTMFCIGSVRCLNVLKPLKYRIWITHFRLKIVNCLIWIYFTLPVLLYVLLFNKWEEGVPCDVSLVLGYRYAAMMGAHLIIVAVISTGFYIVFIRSIKKSRQMKHGGTCHNTNFKAERKRTIMVMIVVACYYACWIPSAIHTFINALVFPDVPEPQWSHLFQQFALFLVFTNSLMNPFIYAGFNQGFRYGFRVVYRDTVRYTAQPNSDSFIASTTFRHN